MAQICSKTLLSRKCRADVTFKNVAQSRKEALQAESKRSEDQKRANDKSEKDDRDDEDHGGSTKKVCYITKITYDNEFLNHNSPEALLKLYKNGGIEAVNLALAGNSFGNSDE